MNHREPTTHAAPGVEFRRPRPGGVAVADRQTEHGERAVHWYSHERGVYEAEVRVVPREGGGLRARAPGFPDVNAEGATEDEALAAISAALVRAIEGRLAAGEGAPRGRSEQPLAAGEARRWVLVEVDGKSGRH